MLGHILISDGEKGVFTDKNYFVDTQSMNKKTPPTLTQINIFTDGSQTPFHVGAGYTIQLMGTEIHSNSIKLPLNTTVFQAEIIAIQEATRKMLSAPVDKCESIKILTNLQASLQALDDTTYTSRAVKDTMTPSKKTGNCMG